MNSLIILVLTFATAFALPSNLIIPAGRPEGRITRGHDAKEGQFPYQVGLSVKSTDLKYYWCGGSLLNNEWVLTAAHCTVDLIEVTVILGTTNRNIVETMHVVTPNDVINHKNYNPISHKNDIALVRIPYTEYTPNIRPVELPSMSGSYSDYISDTVIASGWGRTRDEPGSSPDVLQWTNLSIIPNSACQRFRAKIEPSNICTGTFDGVNICDGDSGGPIVLASSKVQIGLTSFGANSCLADFPAVFTRITSYLEWIKHYTGVSY